ncbi:MAG: hypothetical protein JXA73_19560, partial [Acidobacteria bacterium]|nr:hypothetical protein [Acidobacteriota bacterium]
MRDLFSFGLVYCPPGGEKRKAPTVSAIGAVAEQEKAKNALKRPISYLYITSKFGVRLKAISFRPPIALAKAS